MTSAEIKALKKRAEALVRALYDEAKANHPGQTAIRAKSTSGVVTDHAIVNLYVRQPKGGFMLSAPDIESLMYWDGADLAMKGDTDALLAALAAVEADIPETVRKTMTLEAAKAKAKASARIEPRRPAYSRDRWRVPFDMNPAAYRVLLTAAQSRLEGHEHDAKRPPMLTRLAADGARVEVRGELMSSPTGWTLKPNLKAKLLLDGKTELIARLCPDGTMDLTQWMRNDERNQRNVNAMLSALEQVADNPRKALLWSRHNCAVCGRALTDPISREQGIGPECRASGERMLRAIEAGMES